MLNIDFKQEYQKWCDYKDLDNNFKLEITEVAHDAGKLQEMFYKHLEFGTGGLRGIMGAGINRMNVYTVRRVTQGIAKYINHEYRSQEKIVVIAYDSRNNSRKFAEETAKVFAGHGIQVYIFEDVRSTPELSFAIKELKANCGIIITASHNPPIYNGYKVYGSNGAQLPPEISKRVLEFINKDNINIFNDIVAVNNIDHHLIKTIGSEIDIKYYEALSKYQVNSDLTKNNGSDLCIVYTPLHGVGYQSVKSVMDKAGFTNFHVVESQKAPDGDFPTVEYPNPEDKACFKLSFELANQKNADLIIANDPDADRIGIAIKDENNNFQFINGNQVGVLLCNYLIEQKVKQNNMPKNPFVVSTVVTGRMVSEICKQKKIEYYDTYTGFKNICEKSTSLESQGKNFIFGFEESYGYLSGTHAADKDGIQSALLISEMALYYKKKDLNLLQVLGILYSKYGYYYEDQLAITKEGISGITEIQRIMATLRNDKINNFGEFKVEVFKDYLTQRKHEKNTGEVSNINMPSENLIYFELSNGLEFAVRPSGTEPKIKFYIFARSKSEKDAKTKSELLHQLLKLLI